MLHQRVTIVVSNAREKKKKKKTPMSTMHDERFLSRSRLAINSRGGID